MRNCFFIISIFCANCNTTFMLSIFSLKITNHCLVLFVIFHIKHQSFPLRALSSSGYSQSASLRSSIPNNCSAFHQKELIFYPYQKLIISMQYCYFTFLFRYDRIYLVKKIQSITPIYTHQKPRKR